MILVSHELGREIFQLIAHGLPGSYRDHPLIEPGVMVPFLVSWRFRSVNMIYIRRNVKDREN